MASSRPRPRNIQKKQDIKLEGMGIALLAFALLCFAVLINPSTGVIGGFLKKILVGLAGRGQYLFPVLFAVAGIRLLFKSREHRLNVLVLSLIVFLFVILTALDLRIPLNKAFSSGWQGAGGGLIGALGSVVLQRLFGLPGTYIILVALALLATVFLTNHSLVAILKTAYRKLAPPAGNTCKKTLDYLFPVVEEPVTVEQKPPVPVIEDHTQSERRPTIQFTPREVQIPKQPVKNEEISFTAPPAPVVDIFSAQVNNNSPGVEEDYQLPPLSLLARPARNKSYRNTKDISENIRILEETLENFGVKAKVTHVSRGPAITRYEIQPPAGVKVSRIVSLADDIALSMAAPDVRIEAPIPGKAAVGIEVPNKEISMVHLVDLLETGEFQDAASKLSVALGKDITGNPVVADLAKMPHLLIAGATGAGKSVCLNTLIASILFKARPDEIKFLLIDPKMVELAMFNGIPHLVSPVVTDAKKAAASLRWAVKEMEHRYSMFAKLGVRDITRYNRFCRTKGGENKPLPLIVLVIDELADLMMVAPADVEDAVCRLAQMARAAGIHLVVATQRPSVDVITGLIKANIPSRVSFAVSSQIDSRTILDMPGAEKLLGKGDMLFFPVGASKPQRVQGAYLSDREVENLVAYLKQLSEPLYEERFNQDELPEPDPVEEVEDELLPRAIEILIENGNASISMLQRRMHIGYARAARLIDIMEQKGIVGSFEGSKPRPILITLEQFRQQYKK